MKLAIIDANILTCMGLQRIIEDIIPIAEISIFPSFEEMVISHPEEFMHFFVSSGIYFEHAQYFISQPHRSIVLVYGDNYPRLSGLLTLNVCQSEKRLTKELLSLYGRMSHNPRNHQCTDCSNCNDVDFHDTFMQEKSGTLLSPRETEVAVLLAKGYINKEIADHLCISLTTVISHRKNIMEKLNARSLADIIIYVVMNGLVRIEEL